MATKWQIENRERWHAYMREYRLRNKERIRERTRQYEATPEGKEKKKARQARFYQKHRTAYAVIQKAYYEANAATICARQRQPEYRRHANELERKRRATNPEYYKAKQREKRLKTLDLVRFYKKVRYARERGAVGICTPEQLKARFAYYGNRCAYCYKANHLTVDHKIPLVKGGTQWPANLVPACRRCNSRKHDKPYLVFLEEIRGD